MSNPEDLEQPKGLEDSETEETPSIQNPTENNSKEKEHHADSNLIASASVGDSAPMVPLKPTSDRTVVSIMENPSVLEALVHEAPAEVMEFVEASDNRQFKYFSQKEENRHKELLAGENTKRIAIGVVFGTALIAFVYSAVTGDSTLPNQIITVIVAGFGGLGVRELFQRKEE